MLRDNNTWGVIQELRVTADTRTSLKSAITIAMVEHQCVSHWEVKDGSLHIKWHADKFAIPLMNEIRDPEKVTQLAVDWLKGKTPDGSEPDTDGAG